MDNVLNCETLCNAHDGVHDFKWIYVWHIISFVSHGGNANITNSAMMHTDASDPPNLRFISSFLLWRRLFVAFLQKRKQKKAHCRCVKKVPWLVSQTTYFKLKWRVFLLQCEPDDQPACLQKDFASFSVWEEARRAVAGHLMAASPSQPNCSQRPEHLTLPAHEKHCRPVAASQLARLPVIYFFPSFPYSVTSSRALGDGTWMLPEKKSFQKCTEAWQRRLAICLKDEGEILIIQMY